MNGLMNKLKIKAKKILRRIEKYTKTDMVYLARSGFWSLLGQGVGSLSSFIVVFLLANILSKETFGQYRFILSVIPIFTLFTLPGIGTTLVRSIARGHVVDLTKIAKTKIKWSLLGSFLALGVSFYYFYLGNNLLGFALIFVAIFLPFIETFYIYSAYFKGKQDFKTAAIYDSISRIFQAGIIIIIAFITKNVVVLIIAFFIGQLIARFFFYKKTLKYMSQQVSIEDPISGVHDDTISYGKHLSILNIVSTITDNLDKLLVWHFLGAETLAIYYIALTIPKNVVLLFNVVPRVAFPKFSKNTWEAAERKKVVRKIFLFFAVLIIPALIYALLVPFVIPIIFRAYHASIFPAMILASLIVISPVNAMVGQILFAQKSIKKILAVQIMGVVVFTSAFLAMYKNLNASGAAIALVVSGTASLFIGIFLVK